MYSFSSYLIKKSVSACDVKDAGRSGLISLFRVTSGERQPVHLDCIYTLPEPDSHRAKTATPFQQDASSS